MFWVSDSFARFVCYFHSYAILLNHKKLNFIFDITKTTRNECALLRFSYFRTPVTPTFSFQLSLITLYSRYFCRAFLTYLSYLLYKNVSNIITKTNGPTETPLATILSPRSFYLNKCEVGEEQIEKNGVVEESQISGRRKGFGAWKVGS